MPVTQVVFYAERGGRPPVLEWLRDLKRRDRQGLARCIARMEQLAAMGHELRRPAADYLRDGIYELRAKSGRVQYRILYFFHGRDVVVLAHAIVKAGAAVPAADVDKAGHRKRMYERDPDEHTYEGSLDHG